MAAAAVSFPQASNYHLGRRGGQQQEEGRTTAAAAAAAATVIRGVVTSPSIFPATKNVPPFTLAHTQHMLSTDNFAAVKY